MQRCLFNSLLSALVPGLLLMACSGKPAARSATHTPAGEAIHSSHGFHFPADSQLTAQHVDLWLSCNALLDSLTWHYRDSFSISDSTLLHQRQQAFILAQDSICKKSGLKGGYQEYLWILQAINLPRNRNLLN